MERKEIALAKYFNVDENIIYPSCNECNEELSPYVILKAEDKSLTRLLRLGMMYGFIQGKPIILLCKNCTDITIIKGEK